MFEDSLVESCGRISSDRLRWIAVGSLGLQCLIAGVIVLVPVLRPEALPFRLLSPAVVVPMLKKPPVVVEQRRVNTAQAAAPSMPSVMAATRAAILPSMKPVEAEMDGGVTVASNLTGMGTPQGVGDLLGVGGVSEPKVVVAQPKKTSPVRISSGVSSGLLLGQIQPVYPRIAVAARVEGVVVIEATISKTGTIESARVVSGPPMLAGAAIAAVRGARYRPYLLNGEATEVQTTVTVNFRLGS